MLNRSDSAGNFSRDECFAAPRTFVIEENAVARAQPVALAIVYRRPVGEKTFATPYGLRGQNGVVSVCGTSCTLPNISLLDAW